MFRMLTNGRVGLVCLCGILAAIAGCGGGSSSVPDSGPELFYNSALHETGDLYRNVVLDTQKPPTSVADFAKYENGFPSGFREVKAGNIVVLWGAPLVESNTTTILAYEKAAPEAGGQVMMQDTRTVKKLTAEEFKAAPKAPGKAQEKPK
jgi:hypothetical protein